MSLIRDLGIILFFPGKICYVKRPQLSNTAKSITQRSSSWGGGGVVGSGQGCDIPVEPCLSEVKLSAYHFSHVRASSLARVNVSLFLLHELIFHDDSSRFFVKIYTIIDI